MKHDATRGRGGRQQGKKVRKNGDLSGTVGVKKVIILNVNKYRIITLISIIFNNIES